MARATAAAAALPVEAEDLEHLSDAELSELERALAAGDQGAVDRLAGRGVGGVSSGGNEDARLTRFERASSIEWRIVALIAGVVGLVSSLALCIERTHQLQAQIAGEQAQLICDINPFISCGGVMASPAASIFGFSNAFFGIACFTVLITTVMASFAGARFGRWYWVGLEIGCVLSIVLICFLQVQSIFVIGKLCLWCMIVWSVTIPNFVITTDRSALHGVFGRGMQRLAVRTHPFRWLIVAAWWLLIFGIIMVHFAPYF